MDKLPLEIDRDADRIKRKREREKRNHEEDSHESVEDSYAKWRTSRYHLCSLECEATALDSWRGVCKRWKSWGKCGRREWPANLLSDDEIIAAEIIFGRPSLIWNELKPPGEIRAVEKVGMVGNFVQTNGGNEGCRGEVTSGHGDDASPSKWRRRRVEAKQG